MARNPPNRGSRRRVQETSDLRDANGHPTTNSNATPPSGRTPSSESATVPSCSSRRLSNPDSSPSSNETSLNGELSLTAVGTPRNTSTPLIPTRPAAGDNGDNSAGRSNRVLSQLIQTTRDSDEAERANNARENGNLPAAILQQLNALIEKQESLNTRLEQRMEAFEEQTRKEREKTPKRLPKAVTVSGCISVTSTFCLKCYLFILIFCIDMFFFSYFYSSSSFLLYAAIIPSDKLIMLMRRSIRNCNTPPGHLTVHRARGGGNLNVALEGGDLNRMF